MAPGKDSTMASKATRKPKTVRETSGAVPSRRDAVDPDTAPAPAPAPAPIYPGSPNNPALKNIPLPPPPVIGKRRPYDPLFDPRYLNEKYSVDVSRLIYGGLTWAASEDAFKEVRAAFVKVFRDDNTGKWQLSNTLASHMAYRIFAELGPDELTGFHCQTWSDSVHDDIVRILAPKDMREDAVVDIIIKFLLRTSLARGKDENAQQRSCHSGLQVGLLRVVSASGFPPSISATTLAMWFSVKTGGPNLIIGGAAEAIGEESAGAGVPDSKGNLVFTQCNCNGDPKACIFSASRPTCTAPAATETNDATASDPPTPPNMNFEKAEGVGGSKGAGSPKVSKATESSENGASNLAHEHCLHGGPPPLSADELIASATAQLDTELQMLKNQILSNRDSPELRREYAAKYLAWSRANIIAARAGAQPARSNYTFPVPPIPNPTRDEIGSMIHGFHLEELRKMREEKDEGKSSVPTNPAGEPQTDNGKAEAEIHGTHTDDKHGGDATEATTSPGAALAAAAAADKKKPRRKKKATRHVPYAASIEQAWEAAIAGMQPAQDDQEALAAAIAATGLIDPTFENMRRALVNVDAAKVNLAQGMANVKAQVESDTDAFPEQAVANIKLAREAWRVALENLKVARELMNNKHGGILDATAAPAPAPTAAAAHQGIAPVPAKGKKRT